MSKKIERRYYSPGGNYNLGIFGKEVEISKTKEIYNTSKREECYTRNTFGCSNCQHKIRFSEERRYFPPSTTCREGF